MKLIKRVVCFALGTSAVLLTQTAAAYLQLSYSSEPLHFIQGYLNGDADDSLGSEDPPYPSFNIVFDKVAETSSQTLLGNALANVIGWPTLNEQIPIVNGSLTLGANGAPTAWDFSLQTTKTTPGVRDLEFDENGELIYFNEFTFPSNTSWLFQSSFGEGTCNCDRYRYDDDLYIERPYYSWAQAATVGFVFGGKSSPEHWSVTNVDVPEPKTYLLFVLGLIVIGARKMRAKKII
ncbi:MAG: PEP-CTERM sorting domain-containing protein [Gammaproteobacteria bacterium]|nr:MAG: PEP-CTERM sorting domain-containing protein [Gammaproteobacteria bacterium]